MQLTDKQFAALAELIRLRPDSVSSRAARLHMVDGLTIGDAARECGTAYKTAWSAVERVKQAHALAVAATA